MHMRGVIGLIVWLAAACKFPELPPVEEWDGPDSDAVDVDSTGRLPLSVVATGEGVVASDPLGIACPSDCEHDYDGLSQVELAATATVGSVFEGWSGDCSGTADCIVTMDAPKAVSALFRAHGAARWARQIGLSGDELDFEAATDQQGNVVVAGTVHDGNDYDLFAIKYRANDGEIVWMRHLDTPDDSGEFFGGVATDTAGNVYIASKLQSAGSVMYDLVSVTGDVFGNIIVLRLKASDGTVEWGKSWGGSAVDFPNAIAISGSDMFVTGSTSSNPSVFDSRTLAAQTNNGFVARASIVNGVAAQAKLVPGNVNLDAIAVNGTSIAVVGAVRAPMSLDICSVSVSNVGYDAMVLNLDRSTLACQWARNYGDNAANMDARASDVASFPGGGWVLTGYFEGVLGGFGPSGLPTAGGDDVFIARLAPDGTTSWVYRYGGDAAEIGRGVATSPEGNVVLSGSFENELVLGSFALTGSSNVFVTRLSSGATPIHEWAVSIGGNDDDYSEDLVLATDDSVYLVSKFVGMTRVGSADLSSLGVDVWVAGLVR